MGWCSKCNDMKAEVERMEAEVERVKFEYKMKEKEVVKQLRLQHKEEQMAFRERVRQDAFDNQMTVMNDAVKKSLETIITAELDKRVRSLQS